MCPEEGTRGVAYDTAWTARVRGQDGKSLFPECLAWLITNQKQDGSWGGAVENFQDRVISTLSALIALKELGGTKFENQIKQGETYIWNHVDRMETHFHRLIGVELLFPSLMEQAETLDLGIPYHINPFKKQYQAKLKKIDESLWYSPLVTLSYSLEFLNDRVDVDNLAKAQLPNGSVATSPAATAFFLNHIRSDKAYRYLKKILSLTRDGSMMTVYPIEVFEYGWTMYNLMLAGLYFERYGDICDFLYSGLQQTGVGWSTELPVTDADDTALACRALCAMDFPVNFDIFNPYDMREYYIAFNHELDPSVSTNIHILDIARLSPRFPDREHVIEKLIAFLKKEMQPGGYWIDKWHASPYYTTSHAIIALSDSCPSLASKGISWILQTMNSDGTWGFNGGTLEETAYAIQALMYYHRHVESVDIEHIQQAAQMLCSRKCRSMLGNPEELWIGKVLYTPVRVILSLAASAQFMVKAQYMQSFSATH
jgi:halimadienyl-diphosphate synthase